jgi:hypothetical protein
MDGADKGGRKLMEKGQTASVFRRLLVEQTGDRFLGGRASDRFADEARDR